MPSLKEWTSLRGRDHSLVSHKKQHGPTSRVSGKFVFLAGGVCHSRKCASNCFAFSLWSEVGTKDVPDVVGPLVIWKTNHRSFLALNIPNQLNKISLTRIYVRLYIPRAPFSWHSRAFVRHSPSLLNLFFIFPWSSSLFVFFSSLF